MHVQFLKELATKILPWISAIFLLPQAGQILARILDGSRGYSTKTIV